MKMLIEKIKKMGGYFETISVGETPGGIEVWYVKSVDSSVANNFLKDHHEQAFKNNGLLCQMNSYVPTLSVNDLVSVDRIDSVLSEKYTIDLFYCPDVKEFGDNLIDLAYRLADLRLDYGEYGEDVLIFLEDISKICKLVPFEIDKSFLTCTIQNVTNVHHFERFIDEKYIPLLLKLGRLDESPSFVKTEILRSKFVML